MRLLSFLSALELGKSLYIANISYSAAFRVLKQVGFPLDHSTYYNIRSRLVSINLDEFASYIVALEDAGFIFEYQVEEEINLINRIVIS
jgi:hypothetical protein